MLLLRHRTQPDISGTIRESQQPMRSRLQGPCQKSPRPMKPRDPQEVWLTQEDRASSAISTSSLPTLQILTSRDSRPIHPHTCT